jgi:hypothetical protein
VFEGKLKIPHPEMMATGVRERWNWRYNKEIKRLIPQKGRRCPDHREMATKSGSFGLIY